MQNSISPAGCRSLLGVLATGVALAAGTADALATPAALNLRIEGLNSTIYEGPVTSDGHVVRPRSEDDHACDGTNGGANPAPGPTPTSALDDGARAGGYSWDGKYFDSFNDYLIKRIGPDSATDTKFWGQFVNSKPADTGGCQGIVKSGDEVLWAFDAFSKAHALRLAGPAEGVTGDPLELKVSDGATGAPLGGARVGDGLSGADGVVTLSFATPGIYRLKAERDDSVRSNALPVCIDPPGVIACTSTDRTAPDVRLDLPMFLSDISTSRSFSVAWEGKDPGGSGITSYDLDARIAGGSWSGRAANTVLTRAPFRAKPGTAYEFRVSAVDRAGNRSGFATDSVAVPVDDRDCALVRFSRGWERLARKAAWGGFVRRSTRPEAGLRARLRGSRVALIGRRLRRGGRARVTVDGRSTVLRLRGHSRFRSVLYLSGPLRSGEHSVRLKTLDRRPVEIDAVAVLP